MISQKKSAMNKILSCLFDLDAGRNSDPKNLMNPKGGKEIKRKSSLRNAIEDCKRKMNGKVHNRGHD